MPAAKPRVVVYSAAWCPWCAREKDWLAAHKIAFEDRDVEKDPQAAAEMTKKSGQTAIPVTDVDGKIIIGFDVEELKKALKIRD